MVAPEWADGPPRSIEEVSFFLSASLPVFVFLFVSFLFRFKSILVKRQGFSFCSVLFSSLLFCFKNMLSKQRVFSVMCFQSSCLFDCGFSFCARGCGG
eukprot:COSAG01_NODE_9196_length_2524_cov_1.633402_1_plen_98_part_00